MGFLWRISPVFFPFSANLCCGGAQFGSDRSSEEMRDFLAKTLFLNLIWNYSAFIKEDLFDLFSAVAYYYHVRGLNAKSCYLTVTSFFTLSSPFSSKNQLG